MSYPYLGTHGRALWEALNENELDAPTSVLVVQICRIVDHLDRLDRILRSKETWVNLAEQAEDEYPDTKRIKIVMDSALIEFRQQATALSTILTKLGIGKIDPESLIIKEVTESKADELARKRAERLQAAKSSQ